MGTKAQWQPGRKSTDAVATIEATDSQLGTFSIRNEDPSGSDDDIADSFQDFARGHAEKQHAERKRNGNAEPIDLQHAVPIQDQLENLGKSASDADTVKRHVTFQRYVDGSPQGAPFTRQQEVIFPPAQSEEEPEGEPKSVRGPATELTGGAPGADAATNNGPGQEQKPGANPGIDPGGVQPGT